MDKKFKRKKQCSNCEYYWEIQGLCRPKDVYVQKHHVCPIHEPKNIGWL